MKYVKMTFWIVVFFILFILFTLNVAQNVDFRYFYGVDDVFQEIPLFVVIFFSMAIGFLFGIILISGELFHYRRQARKQEVEIDNLRKEIDTHRNVAVKEFLNGETDDPAGGQ